MAKRGVATKRVDRRTPDAKVRSTPGTRVGSGAAELENLIHGRFRLGIMSALASNETLSFSELKALLRTSDGNLSVHARKLEDAEYVVCLKVFEGRVPKTRYRITPRGKRALAKYLNHMEALIRATKRS